jgi:hypothetical protein
MIFVAIAFVLEVMGRMYALGLGWGEGQYLDFTSRKGSGLFNVTDLVVTLIDVTSIVLEQIELYNSHQSWYAGSQSNYEPDTSNIPANDGGSGQKTDALQISKVLRALRFVRLVRVMRLLRNKGELVMALNKPLKFVVALIAFFFYICFAWEWFLAFLANLLNAERHVGTNSRFGVLMAELPILLAVCAQ